MDKLLAEPKFDKESGKWNIEIEMDSERILLGHMEGIFAVHEKYESEDEAIEYINNKDKLQLRREV